MGNKLVVGTYWRSVGGHEYYMKILIVKMHPRHREPYAFIVHSGPSDDSCSSAESGYCAFGFNGTHCTPYHSCIASHHFETKRLEKVCKLKGVLEVGE